MKEIPGKIVQITTDITPAVPNFHPSYRVLTALTDAGKIYEKRNTDEWVEVSLRVKF